MLLAFASGFDGVRAIAAASRTGQPAITEAAAVEPGRRRSPGAARGGAADLRVAGPVGRRCRPRRSMQSTASHLVWPRRCRSMPQHQDGLRARRCAGHRLLASSRRQPAARRCPRRSSGAWRTAIYFEARGESYRGQVAVAQVVMNRVKHRLYPKTICGVVFQNQNKRNACQFSFACDGIPERVTDAKSWKQAAGDRQRRGAGQPLRDRGRPSTHYHATYVYPALGAADEEADQDRPPRLLPVQERLALRLSRRSRTT